MPPPLRICSLLPSATEIVCALGLIDQLVAISHECDYPPEVRSKTVITSSTLAASQMHGAEIDALVSQRLHEHSGIYALDETALAQLGPDLILTQELCDVCAVSYEQVQEAVRALHGEQTVLSLEPESLDGVMATIRAVGDATDRTDRATALVEHLNAGLDEIRTRSAGLVREPVVCLEWLDPPFSAGHWVPDLVQAAGAENRLSRSGERSRRLPWSEVLASDPELIVLMPCGFGVEQALVDYRHAALPDDWSSLAAVRTARVFAVDANAYFSRPGPRLVRGAEILHEIITATNKQMAGDGWARVPLQR